MWWFTGKCKPTACENLIKYTINQTQRAKAAEVAPLHIYLLLILLLLSLRGGEGGKAPEGLTDHVDGGSPRPHSMMLLDGVVESRLTQLNGSHTDPEAQAEQPRHDRTHLLRTSRGGVKKYIMFSTYDLISPQHTLSHKQHKWTTTNKEISIFRTSSLIYNWPPWRSLLVIQIYH